METDPHFGAQQSRQVKRWWTHDEDRLLRELVTLYGPKNWKKIATSFPNRTDV
jgi:myb-related protein